MSVRALISVIAVGCVLSACVSVPYGQEKDGYKIEEAGGQNVGFNIENPDETTYRYTFGFSVPKNKELSAVKVERISGSQKEVVVDDNPAANSSDFKQNPDGSQSRFIDNSWVGQSKELKFNCTEAVWLCKRGNTRETYQFTITDKSGKTTVIQQATIIDYRAKQNYLYLFNHLK